MNDIVITDLFGINILDYDNFNKDYIIINFSNEYIDDLLIPINQYNGTYIYKLDKSNKILKKIFDNTNIQIDDYIELGNYIIYDINNIKIILVNKDACIITNKYTLIDVINNLYVWKPVSMDKDFTNFGVICTDNNYTIPNKEIGLIPSSHIKSYDYNNESLFQNDFNILGNKKNGQKKLLTYNIIKLTDNKNNKNDKIIEHFSNNISDKPLESKHLVLVESDDPWFINKNDTIKLKYIKNDNFYGSRESYPEGASFKSNTVLDQSSPTLGYGYSYAERKNIIKEKFANINDSSNHIILIMLVIIVALFLYNIYIKKYKKINK